VLVSTLLADLEAGKTPAPVLLFTAGKAPFQKEAFEPLLADRAAERITSLFVDPSLRDLAYSTFYADEVAPGEIVSEAQTVPFLAERRVILVRSAERYNLMSGEKKSPLTPLIGYLNAPSEFTILMFISGDVDKRKRFYKACEAAGEIIECPQLSDSELARWIADEAARNGKRLAAAASRELVARAGMRLGDINNALQLVCSYVGERDEIREADVVTACADVAEETVWTLTDAIADSNSKKALHALNDLLEIGKSADEIMGIINWLLESAYRALPETQATIKSHFVAKKVLPLAHKLGVAKFKDAFSLCTDTHFLIRSTGVDQRLALELLVAKLSAPFPKRRKAAAARS